MSFRKYSLVQNLSSPVIIKTPRTLKASHLLPRYLKVSDCLGYHGSLTLPICKMSSSAEVVGDGKIVLERPAQLAKEIFMKAVESVKPLNLMRTRIKMSPESVLRIGNEDKAVVDLKLFKRIFVIGFGKAVLPMAEELLSIMDDRVSRCMVNIPQGFRDSMNAKIEINRGATDNIPDEAAYQGSQKIIQLIKSCQSDDLLIVLISGGGSALLPYPIPPITIQEKSSLIKTLSKAGASIQELNTVRKRLSLVKGGGLLSLCNSSRIISLLLSDVLGDPLDIIASGPTVPNVDPGHLAKEIVQMYTPLEKLPGSIRQVLEYRAPPSVSSKSIVTNTIIGNNSIALEMGVTAVRDLKLYPFLMTNKLCGEASSVGAELGHVAQAVSYLLRCERKSLEVSVYSKAIKNVGNKLGWDTIKTSDLLARILDDQVRDGYEGVCLLFGGETIVHVQGTGVGGRNQELVLNAAIRMNSGANNDYVQGKIAVLSAGTDGFDGPCDAAGAVIDSTTIKNGYMDKLSPFQYLVQNNSYNYFKANSNGVYHIITGHTETNVMDLVVIVVLK